jgi:hypothetical protein
MERREMPNIHYSTSISVAATNSLPRTPQKIANLANASFAKEW